MVIIEPAVVEQMPANQVNKQQTAHLQQQQQQAQLPEVVYLACNVPLHVKPKQQQTQRVYCETTLPLNPQQKKKTKNASRPIKLLSREQSKSNATNNSIKEQLNCNAKEQNEQNKQQKQQQTQKTKPKRRTDKSDLGENFIAPDGGWAWLVCIAAGISNLCLYPSLQQFGFLFRERMNVLGMTSSQITTIINTNPAISACTGLLNGPMFRRFTFRQVAIAGSCCVFSGLVLTAFCETFAGYMITYALLYGFGMGISVSASSLAINTYFKNKRRRACGFSWGITGLGPIFLPFVVTSLLSIYGVQGTVILAAGFSLHSMISALIYQPVRYHTKPVSAEQELAEPEYQCAFCTLQHRKETGIFSSQYLYQDDDETIPGYEITEPGTPMLSRANDGYFGSKLSLASNKPRVRTMSSSKDCYDGQGNLKRLISLREHKEHRAQRQASVSVDGDEEGDDVFFKPNNFRRERDEALRQSPGRGNCKLESAGSKPPHCTCAEERELLELERLEGLDNKKSDSESSLETPKKISFLQKVVTFFDLDLLRDFTYVNLVAGMTIINFGELNFSILTPFILSDFGLTTSQMTTAIAVLSTMDLIMRFLLPFITEKISWDNRVFFLIGVVGLALGRTVVACTRAYPVILSAFVWIGICKGIRTIFWPLVIPSYVPLKRLPAASGLQLLIAGLFTLAFGPFVGLVRDRFNYAVTLHCLNMMSFTAAISWTLEALIRRHRRKRK